MLVSHFLSQDQASFVVAPFPHALLTIVSVLPRNVHDLLWKAHEFFLDQVILNGFQALRLFRLFL